MGRNGKFCADLGLTWDGPDQFAFCSYRVVGKPCYQAKDQQRDEGWSERHRNPVRPFQPDPVPRPLTRARLQQIRQKWHRIPGPAKNCERRLGPARPQRVIGEIRIRHHDGHATSNPAARDQSARLSRASGRCWEKLGRAGKLDHPAIVQSPPFDKAAMLRRNILRSNRYAPMVYQRAEQSRARRAQGMPEGPQIRPAQVGIHQQNGASSHPHP